MKLVQEKPKQWHTFLALLMFEVREVPQTSTGFPPFELLYGKNPRGILDLLREKWEEGSDLSKPVLQQIMDLRESLNTAWNLAKKAVGRAQVS